MGSIEQFISPRDLKRLYDSDECKYIPDPEEEKLVMTDKQKKELEWDLGWELHKYARTQEREKLKTLLKEGGAYCGAPDVFADLNWQNEFGSTPLWWTCMHGDEELTQLLIDAGADLDQCDDDLWTPVSVASRYGHDNCLELLINAGADLTIKVADGDYALDKANFWEHDECEHLLKQAGAPMAFPPVPRIEVTSSC
mmetsp:Transcript_55299/g.91569  ORF Transcript_55299/g.91569 Transcript_55299/m.91569 type:complete len:197 (+) Transcript_55299:35-625(+)